MLTSCMRLAVLTCLASMSGVAVLGCAVGQRHTAPTLTSAERTAVADSIERLSRQRPDSAARSVDCDQLARRGRAALPAGLTGRTAPDFNIVSQGRIFRSGSNEQLAEMCRWSRSVRESRLWTQDDTLDYQIHILDRDAAYELVSISETIHWTDGRTTEASATPPIRLRDLEVGRQRPVQSIQVALRVQPSSAAQGESAQNGCE